ncbi:hypothetical protein V6N13_098393 [Hibiscus sabdariffa]
MMDDVEDDLAGLSIGEDEEELLDLAAEPPQSDLPSDLCFDVQFGWDISLRAPARRGGVPSSPWLIEDGGIGASLTGGVNLGRLISGNIVGKNLGGFVATNFASSSSQKGLPILRPNLGHNLGCVDTSQLDPSGVGLGPVVLGQNYDVDMAQLGRMSIWKNWML